MWSKLYSVSEQRIVGVESRPPVDIQKYCVSHVVSVRPDLHFVRPLVFRYMYVFLFLLGFYSVFTSEQERRVALPGRKEGYYSLGS